MIYSVSMWTLYISGMIIYWVGGKCKCKMLIFFHKPNLGFLYKMALNVVNKHGRGSHPKLGDEAMSSDPKKGQLPRPCLFTKLRAILYSKPHIPTGITRIFFHCTEYLIVCMCVNHMNWNICARLLGNFEEKIWLVKGW